MRTILGYIKFISKRNLIFPAAVLVVMLILLFVLPIKSILFPAHASSLSEIFSRYEKGDRYLDINITDLHYTGYDFYKGKDAAASYYYVLDEESSDTLCMFFLLPSSSDKVPEPMISMLEGKVKLLSNNSYFRQFLSEYSKEIGWSSDGLEDACKGILISNYDYHPAIFIILAVLIILVIILCIIYIISNLLCIINPARHEACRRLRRFGLDASDFRDIDSELKNNCIIRSGNLNVTNHYLVAFTSRSIFVLPLYNIVWAYKYSTWHRFSRTSKLNYSMIVVTEPADRITIPGCTKKDADTILRFLRREFRHITVGYSEENRRKFENK